MGKHATETHVTTEINNLPAANSAHRKAPHARFIPVSSMESGWTSAYADGTVATDNTTYTTGLGSLKITAASTGALSGAKYSLTANWSTKVIRFFVKCDNWANINALEMMVSTSGYFTSFWTSSFSYELANTPNNEWLEITLTRSSFQNGGGTPDWTTVNNLIFRLTAVNGTTPSIWVDDLTVYEQAKKPVISFVFDDGWESQFTVARPKMDEHGYKGTAYIIPSGIGAANTFTQAHIDSLARNDWDISGHNLTNLGTLTLAQVETDVRATKAYLSKYGYKGSDHYAYPNGVSNDAIKAIVQRYFTTGRNINRISQSSSYVSPMNINSYQVYNSITLAAAKAAVDAAIANNEWLILGFHDIKTTAAINIEWPTADFNALVDYIATKNVDVKTVSEVWEDSFADKTGVIGTHTLLTNIGTNTHDQIDAHLASTANPHLVTKSQVGLANVDNTSDATKNSATATLTNKRITARVSTTASSATPTPSADTDDIYTVTALAAGATFGAPTGTPTNGQELVLRVKDNGIARTLAFNAIYRFSSDLAAPTTTVISKTLYMKFVYNSADTKWDCLAWLNNF